MDLTGAILADHAIAQMAKRALAEADVRSVLSQPDAILEVRPGRDSISKALYRVYTWAEIEPIYGQPWAESVKKAAAARKEAAKRRRESRKS
jgi:hypothetical protein